MAESVLRVGLEPTPEKTIKCQKKSRDVRLQLYPLLGANVTFPPS